MPDFDATKTIGYRLLPFVDPGAKAAFDEVGEWVTELEKRMQSLRLGVTGSQANFGGPAAGATSSTLGRGGNGVGNGSLTNGNGSLGNGNGTLTRTSQTGDDDHLTKAAQRRTAATRQESAEAARLQKQKQDGWQRLSTAGKQAFDNQTAWSRGLSNLEAQRAKDARAAAAQAVQDAHKIQQARQDAWKALSGQGKQALQTGQGGNKFQVGLSNLADQDRAADARATGEREAADREIARLQKIADREQKQQERERQQAANRKARDAQGLGRKNTRDVDQFLKQHDADAARLKKAAAADQARWDLILGGGGRTGTAGMKGPTKGDVADPLGMADYQKKQQHERRQREQAEQRERRDAEQALGRQREGYHRLNESIGQAVDSVTRLGEGMAYLGLSGDKDLRGLSEALLKIRGTVEVLRGGVGAMRGAGGLLTAFQQVHSSGGMGGVARAFFGLGPHSPGQAGSSQPTGTFARLLGHISPMAARGATAAGSSAIGGGISAALGGAAGGGATVLTGGVGGAAMVGGAAIAAIAASAAAVGVHVATQGRSSAAIAGKFNDWTASSQRGMRTMFMDDAARRHFELQDLEQENTANPRYAGLYGGEHSAASASRRNVARQQTKHDKQKKFRDEFVDNWQRDTQQQEAIRSLDLQQRQLIVGERFRPRVGVSQMRNLTIGRQGVDEQTRLVQEEGAAHEKAYEARKNLTDPNSNSPVKLSLEEQMTYERKRFDIEKQVYDLSVRKRDMAKQELDLAKSRYETGRGEKGNFSRMSPIEQQHVLDVYRRGKGGQNLNENELRALEGAGISRFGEIAANQREKQSRTMFAARGGSAAEAEDIFGFGGYQGQEERRLKRERAAIGEDPYNRANQEIETPMRPSEYADEGQRNRRDKWKQEFQEATARLDVENKVVIEAGDSIAALIDQQWPQFLENQNQRIEAAIKAMDQKAEQRLAATRSRINQQGRMLA